jgi:hypothetical protein
MINDNIKKLINVKYVERILKEFLIQQKVLLNVYKIIRKK